MDNLKKYYEVAANALFGGGETKVVKANETLSFEARESETLAIVGEIRLRQVHLREGADGAGNRDRGPDPAGQPQYRKQIPIEERDTKPSPTCRWCSRTRSTR